jgi:predicted nucleic acid-binding protein
MRVLIDTNVALDIFLAREPWIADASAVLEFAEQNRLALFLTASTVTDIFFICRKHNGIKKAFEALKVCIDNFSICTVAHDDIEKAFVLSGVDFEDNLQIAIATRDKLDAIVTRDKRGFQHSVILAITPAELITTLSKAGPDV